MDKRQITITGKHGKPILYASLNEDGSLNLNFEVFGRKNSFDVESIYTIQESEFSKLALHFKIPAELEILDALHFLSTNGQGEQLEQALSDKLFDVKTFVWWHDNE
jgi:hypothetical protein